MASIEKRFETKATALEMKEYINTKLLPNPALSAMLSETHWEANVLIIKSKLGNGTISLGDNYVDIYLELSLIGTMAKKTLESTIDNEFKLLKK